MLTQQVVGLIVLLKKEKEMKEALVYKDQTGYWVAEDRKTNKMIGGYCDSELEAYKRANAYGYVVT